MKFTCCAGTKAAGAKSWNDIPSSLTSVMIFRLGYLKSEHLCFNKVRQSVIWSFGSPGSRSFVLIRISAFLGNRPRLTKEEEMETKLIAKACIHIDKL